MMIIVGITYYFSKTYVLVRHCLYVPVFCTFQRHPPIKTTLYSLFSTCLHLSDVIIRWLLFTYFLLITMIAMFLTETFLRHKLFEKKEEEH